MQNDLFSSSASHHHHWPTHIAVFINDTNHDDEEHVEVHDISITDNMRDCLDRDQARCALHLIDYFDGDDPTRCRNVIFYEGPTGEWDNSQAYVFYDCARDFYYRLLIEVMDDNEEGGVVEKYQGGTLVASGRWIGGGAS